MFAPGGWPTERAAARAAAAVLTTLDRVAAADGVALSAWIGVLTDAATVRFELGPMIAGVPGALPAGACAVVRWRGMESRVASGHGDGHAGGHRAPGTWFARRDGAAEDRASEDGPGTVAGPTLEEAAQLRHWAGGHWTAGHWAGGPGAVRSYGVETCFTEAGPTPVLTCLACEGTALRLSYVALPGQPARCPVPLALHGRDIWGRPFNALPTEAIDTTHGTDA